MTFGSPFPSLGEQIYADSRSLVDAYADRLERRAKMEANIAASLAAQLAARHSFDIGLANGRLVERVASNQRDRWMRFRKPRRLQPGQLAWCAANVPGFVDLLAPRPNIYEEAQV